MSLGDEKYVAVTTFRASGAAVTTPTWITPLSGGRVAFWTSSEAGKAKRLRKDPRVAIQPCDARGRVAPDAGAPLGGTAQLVTSGPDFDAIQTQIKAKHPVMSQLSRVFNTLGHLGKGSHPYGDLGIVITLDS